MEQFTPQFNSAKDKLPVSSMIRSHEQTEFCLKSYGHMLGTLSDGAISLIFQSEMDMITPLLRYLKDDRLKVSTQIEACKVIEVVA